LFAKHDGIGEFKMQSVLSVTKEQKPWNNLYVYPSVGLMI
jgi:hypothetical protein